MVKFNTLHSGVGKDSAPKITEFNKQRVHPIFPEELLGMAGD